MVFTNFEIENDLTKNKKISFKDDLKNIDLTNYLLKRYIVGCSTIMFDKKKIGELTFDSKYHIIGDFDFVMKNSLKKDTVGISEVLVKIKRHQNNETSRKFKLYTLELLNWSNRNEKYFKKYKNFLKFKKSIFYEMAKVNLNENKFKRSLLFLKRPTLKEN